MNLTIFFRILNPRITLIFINFIIYSCFCSQNKKLNAKKAIYIIEMLKNFVKLQVNGIKLQNHKEYYYKFYRRRVKLSIVN